MDDEFTTYEAPTRRGYMKYGGAVVGGDLLAGCTGQSGSESTPTDNSTATDARTPTDTPTETDTRSKTETATPSETDPTTAGSTSYTATILYAGGTPYQGPIINSFQMEMAAKQLYPDEFGAYPGYGQLSKSEQLFDRKRLADIITGDRNR